jgi:hypothetical protein
MARTEFLIPNQIVQVQDTAKDILWNHSDEIISKDSYAVSSDTLHTIPGLYQEVFASRTARLVCTNFNFNIAGATILGVELRLGSIRLARIQDFLIQLTLNGEPIGDNIADVVISDLKIYGGASNTWGTPLTVADVNNSTFGVSIALRSNILIPHKDLAYIDQVAVRITYA